MFRSIHNRNTTMTTRVKLNDRWLKVDARYSDVLLTDGPFHIHFGDTIGNPAVPTDGSVFNSEHSGHSINHVMTIPKGSHAYVCYPRGSYLTGSSMLMDEEIEVDDPTTGNPVKVTVGEPF